MNRVCVILRWLLAIFFVAAGLNHFRAPEMYLAIIPPYLPQPSLLNQISGAAEIAGGIGVLLPAFRAVVGWGLILLLIAVFPANVYGLQHGMTIGGNPVPEWILILRLPFQLVFIAWVWWTCVRRETRRE